MAIAGCGSSSQSNSGSNGLMQLTANPATVAPGEASTLSWSGQGASSCTASGGWSGSQPASGSFQTPPLAESTTYTLSCSGTGRGILARVTVSVDASSGTGAPQVSLRSAKGSVPENGATTLQWQANGATKCVASGGWKGDKPTQGSQHVGGLTADTNYTLSCEGRDGTGVAMTQVMVQRATLRWTRRGGAGAPAAYRVLWGSRSGQPENAVTLANPKVVQHVIHLPGPGTYYFVLAALDASNKELGRSNEASKTLPL